MTTIDLKAYREAAKMSQTTLAEILGVSQSAISRYEDDPESIPWRQMMAIFRALGVDPSAEAHAATPPIATGLDPGAPLERLHQELSLLREFTDKAPAGVADLPEGAPTVGQLLGLVDALGRKPNLALTGPFDGGKSTIANALLGSRSLHTKYQPATRVVTYVRHVDERPSWMKEQVWMLDEGFNPLQWNERDHCTSHKVVAGQLQTLRDFGTHQEGASEEACYALVFLDAPVLKACNIVDLPGFDNDDEDTERAKSNPLQADIVIYACPFQRFLGGADQVRVAQVLRDLPTLELLDPGFPTLGNLFLVATHAGPQISDDDIEGAQPDAARRTFRNVGETVLATRAQQIGRPIDLEVLRGRFFTFYEEMPTRRKRLEEKLLALLERHLPAAWKAKADTEITRFRTRAKGQLAAELAGYQHMLDDMQRAEDELKRVRQEGDARETEMRAQRAHVLARVQESKMQSLAAMYATYDAVVEAGNVERLIRRRFPNRKDAQQNAAAFVFEQLQHQVGQTTATLSEQLTTEINAYLDQYRQAHVELGTDRETVGVPFNVEGAFVGGVAGAATVGALAAWAASLGNLGSYIIAAKAVSLLSALGISIPGGTAAVMSFIAAVGGPITIAAGIVAMATMAGWALFGSSWERRLAKKIVARMAQQDVRGRLGAHLTNYWDDTSAAFERGADEVERRWGAYVDDLVQLVSQSLSGKDDLQQRLAAVEDARDFFAGIPWKAGTPAP